MRGTLSYQSQGMPPTSIHVYPPHFPQHEANFRQPPDGSRVAPPLADKGYTPHPLRSGDPPDPY
jgi:hypothetical protein